MTISNTRRTAGPFIGNGVTADFPFSYKIFTRDDLLVAQTVISTGVETLKVLDADYTVTLNANQNSNPGGVVHMLTAPPPGVTLAMTSSVALVQSLDLTNQGGFYPTAINDALDRMVINIQQLAGKIGQGLSIGSAAISDSALAALATVQQLGGTAGSSLMGFIQSGIGAVKRTMQDKSREWKTPEDFGARGNDPTFDDTPALAALFASAAVNGHSVMLPKKVYYITSLTISGCNETTIISQGAKLRGKYAGSYPHILRIDQSSITMNMSGTLIIDGACNVGYGCGLFIGSGYNDLAGFVFVRCALSMRIDRDFQTSGNRGVSEIKVTGGYTYACLRIVEALGYNTVVNFNGFVASTGVYQDASTSDLPGGVLPAAWMNADSTTIRAIGATLFFTGCHLTNVLGSRLIDVQPIVSPDAPAVAIAYGSVSVVGSNIEAIYLGGSSNPHGYPTPNDPRVAISLTGGCRGFIGGNTNWIDLDANFKGKVRIQDCSFYSNAPRGAYLGVSASPDAHWDCDPGSFGINIADAGHSSGLDAYQGGIAHFATKQTLRINTSATVTQSNGSVTPACTNAIDVGNSTRFIAAYGANGVFTVPKGGLQDVEFDMQFVLTAPAPNADVGVKLNGTLYKFGPATSSPVKTATAYFPRLDEGDTLAPYIGNNTGAPVACDGGTLNQIIISASNP